MNYIFTHMHSVAREQQTRFSTFEIIIELFRLILLIL